MEKFRIHFTINGQEDYFDIEEETLEDVKKIAKEETDKRFLTEKENNFWSEKI